MHPFRFGVMTAATTSRDEWIGQVAAIESSGASTVFASDHFSDKPAPLPALAVAAEHTALKVGTLVLANDFRHPAVVAKEAATVQVLSGGRLELGIGTGWQDDDYAASGIEHDPPGTQVDRFEEAVQVLVGLWRNDRFRFEGEHYRVDMECLPHPDVPPPLLIGGGARRMLGIAGRHADIVGLSAAEITSRSDLASGITTAGELMDEKLAWVGEGAGDRFDALEFNILIFGVTVTDDRRGEAERLARRWGGTPEGILASPHFLVGTHRQIAADLRERRDRWQISYPTVQYPDLAGMAPVITELTGT
jgi:probable F420-dependent oxidoreductase